jgi:hypothetical protein
MMRLAALYVMALSGSCSAVGALGQGVLRLKEWGGVYKNDDPPTMSINNGELFRVLPAGPL